jgi:hypothetical protein
MDFADINSVSMFSKHVDSQFHVELDPEQIVTATLIEATALNGAGQGLETSAREPFSLLFSMEDGVDLPQHVYRVWHDTLGEFQLFLVPLGGGRLESVFN